MVDPVTSHRWMYRILFVTVTALVLFGRLLPLPSVAGQLPGPDLLLCLGFAWVQRRPDILGPTLLGLTLLAADLLLGRPPGLWAGLGLLGAEFLRSRHHGPSEMPFAVELGFVAAVTVGITLLSWVIQLVLVIPHPSLGRLLIQTLFTLVAYPFVVGLTVFAFRLHELSPAEAEAKGAAR